MSTTAEQEALRDQFRETVRILHCPLTGKEVKAYIEQYGRPLPPWRKEAKAYIARQGLPFPIYEPRPKSEAEEDQLKVFYFLDDFALSWERMKELSGWELMENGRIDALLGLNPQFKEGSEPTESQLIAAGYENCSTSDAPKDAEPEEWRYINQRVRVERKTLIETILRLQREKDKAELQQVKAARQREQEAHQQTKMDKEKETVRADTAERLHKQALDSAVASKNSRRKKKKNRRITEANPKGAGRLAECPDLDAFLLRAWNAYASDAALKVKGQRSMRDFFQRSYWKRMPDFKTHEADFKKYILKEELGTGQFKAIRKHIGRAKTSIREKRIKGV